MPTPLSIDLRQRIVTAVDGGASIRKVAARYCVSPSSVSKITRWWRSTGSVAPKPLGGDRRSHTTEMHGGRILALVSRTPDITLDEIRAALREEGVSVGRISIWRLLVRHGLSVKKNRARRRAGARRRGGGPETLEDTAAHARPKPAGIHR